MSVDPAKPSAPDPTPPKSPTEPAGDNADAPRNKLRFKRPGGEAEEPEKPDQAIEILSSLLQDLVAKKDQRPASPEPAPASVKGAKFHRLSKTGSGQPATPAETSPAPDESPASAPGSPAPAPAAPGAPPVTFRPVVALDLDEELRRLRRWKTLALLSLLALAGLVVYVVWFARPAAQPDAPSARSAPVAGWTDASLQQLDRALAADQSGNLKEAQRLASAIGKADTRPPGLAIYLAGLETRLERGYDAEADLLHLQKDAAPEAMAAIQTALAFNFSRSRDLDKAADAAKNAARNDPFSASLFYGEGEAARHLGHLPDAIASFRRALDRVPTGQPEAASLRECIGLKLRLCYLEQGQENEFQTEMNERLQAPAPSGYWLLTGAASALQRKDVPAAADLLGRARNTLGQEQFDALLNDYFFRAYTNRKELAEFFPDPATRRAKLLPTMTRTVEP